MPEGQAAFVDGYTKVSSTAVGLGFDETFGTPMRAFLSVRTADIVYRFSGNNPAGGVSGGHYLASGQSLTLEGTENVRNFRMIRDASTDADVFYTVEAI